MNTLDEIKHLIKNLSTGDEPESAPYVEIKPLNGTEIYIYGNTNGLIRLAGLILHIAANPIGNHQHLDQAIAKESEISITIEKIDSE